MFFPLSFGDIWVGSQILRWFFWESLILRTKSNPKLFCKGNVKRWVLSRCLWWDLFFFQVSCPSISISQAQTPEVYGTFTYICPNQAGFANIFLHNVLTLFPQWRHIKMQLKNWRVPFLVIIPGRLRHWSRSFPGYRWKSLAKMWQCILLILCLGLIIWY